MALALRSVCGVEIRVWLADVGALEAPAIATLQRWMALAILQRARTEGATS